MKKVLLAFLIISFASSLAFAADKESDKNKASASSAATKEKVHSKEKEKVKKDSKSKEKVKKADKSKYKKEKRKKKKKKEEPEKVYNILKKPDSATHARIYSFRHSQLGGSVVHEYISAHYAGKLQCERENGALKHGSVHKSCGNIYSAEDNFTFLGYSKPGFAFYKDIPAGETVQFAAHSSQDVFEFTPEGGKIYCIESYPEFSLEVVGYINFKLIDNDKCDETIAKYITESFTEELLEYEKGFYEKHGKKQRSLNGAYF